MSREGPGAMPRPPEEDWDNSLRHLTSIKMDGILVISILVIIWPRE